MIFFGYRRHQALNFEKYFKWIPGRVASLFNLALSPLILQMHHSQAEESDAGNGSVKKPAIGGVFCMDAAAQGNGPVQ
jgi:hypothetical protein